MDKMVDKIYGKYSKASRARLSAMVDACRRIDECQLPGDIVECGVWQAGHIILARWICPSRVCWLFDTFDGMPEPTDRDVKVHDKGRRAIETWRAKTANGHKWAAASVEEVQGNLRAEGVWDVTKCIMVQGKVEETLKNNVPEKIALLRLDTDWYESTKIELQVLYPRLVKGGVLIVDDYGHWRGSREACQEYFNKKGIAYNTLLKPIDQTGVMMIKP